MFRHGWILITVLGLACSAQAAALQSSDGNGSAAADKQSQAEDNAFPTAQSGAAEKAASKRQAQPDASQPNAPDAAPSNSAPGKQGESAPQGSNGKPSKPAQDNPFPEAQSKAAAKDNQGAGPQSDPSAAADSSSASGYSSSDAHLPAPELGQQTPGKRQKLDSFTRDQTQDGRVQNDLGAADLYMKNGNYRGAFLRYQDALQYDPQNDTALYGAADAMCKQNLTGEAMARFKSYTKDHPEGKYALKAEKMLVHPNKCMHNW